MFTIPLSFLAVKRLEACEKSLVCDFVIESGITAGFETYYLPSVIDYSI